VHEVAAGGHEIGIADAVEFELIAVQAMGAPTVALDDDRGAGDEEVDLIAGDATLAAMIAIIAGSTASGSTAPRSSSMRSGFVVGTLSRC